MDPEAFLSEMFLHERIDVFLIQVGLFVRLEVPVIRFQDLFVSVEGHDLWSPDHLLLEWFLFLLKSELVSRLPKEILNFDFTDVVNRLSIRV